MPIYRVRTNGLDVTIDRPFHAEPMAVVALVFEMHRPANPGPVVHLIGGHYTGVDEEYIDTEQVLRAIGLMEAA
jgi:hypothetical protein